MISWSRTLVAQPQNKHLNAVENYKYEIKYSIYQYQKQVSRPYE